MPIEVLNISSSPIALRFLFDRAWFDVFLDSAVKPTVERRAHLSEG